MPGFEPAGNRSNLRPSPYQFGHYDIDIDKIFCNDSTEVICVLSYYEESLLFLPDYLTRYWQTISWPWIPSRGYRNIVNYGIWIHSQTAASDYEMTNSVFFCPGSFFVNYFYAKDYGPICSFSCCSLYGICSIIFMRLPGWFDSLLGYWIGYEKDLNVRRKIGSNMR